MARQRSNRFKDISNAEKKKEVTKKEEAVEVVEEIIDNTPSENTNEEKSIETESETHNETPVDNSEKTDNNKSPVKKTGSKKTTKKSKTNLPLKQKALYIDEELEHMISVCAMCSGKKINEFMVSCIKDKINDMCKNDKNVEIMINALSKKQ